MTHEPLTGGITSYHFRTAFNELAAASLKVSTETGHRKRYRSNGEKVARMHLQLSDMMRALMQGDRKSRRIPFTIASEQAADLILRLMEFGADNKLSIAEAVIAKLDSNATKDFTHTNQPTETP